MNINAKYNLKWIIIHKNKQAPTSFDGGSLSIKTCFQFYPFSSPALFVGVGKYLSQTTRI